jgi:hypothetical protein
MIPSALTPVQERGGRAPRVTGEVGNRGSPGLLRHGGAVGVLITQNSASAPENRREPLGGLPGVSRVDNVGSRRHPLAPNALVADHHSGSSSVEPGHNGLVEPFELMELVADRPDKNPFSTCRLVPSELLRALARRPD